MLLRLFALALTIGAFSIIPGEVSTAESGAVVHRIVISGTINPATSEFLQKALAAAEAADAQALLIELDTPGGILASTQSMVRQILNSPVPVVVFVAPQGARAASAGTFILMAANVAAMSPGTRVGAAHPVASGGEDIGGDMRAKAENDTVAFIKSIANQRGRNSEWAAEAVLESKSITEDEALELNVIDLVASDTDELLNEIDGRVVTIDDKELTLHTRGASIETHEMSFINKVIDTIAHPNIAVLLFMGGLLGLYVEFTNPGIIFPGVAGALCLILFFISSEVMPMNYAGFLLIALGIALLVAEIFVPSFGVLFIGGITSLTLGLLLLFDTPESDLRVSFWSVLFPAMLGVSAFGGLVVFSIARSHLRPQQSGLEGLIGARGEARTRFSEKGGKIFVAGEWWDAVSDEPVREGERVEVLGVDGMVLNVRKAREGT